jgi:hypothetical protein
MQVFTDLVVAREQNDKKGQPEQPPKQAKEAASAAPAKQHRSRVKIPQPHILAFLT